MVKLIVKAIVINVKRHKNERKSLKHVSMKLLQVSLSCLHFSEGEVKSLCFSQVCGIMLQSRPLLSSFMGYNRTYFITGFST
jgi:hypothetical protein